MPTRAAIVYGKMPQQQAAGRQARNGHCLNLGTAPRVRFWYPDPCRPRCLKIPRTQNRRSFASRSRLYDGLLLRCHVILPATSAPGRKTNATPCLGWFLKALGRVLVFTHKVLFSVIWFAFIAFIKGAEIVCARGGLTRGTGLRQPVPSFGRSPMRYSNAQSLGQRPPEARRCVPASGNVDTGFAGACPRLPELFVRRQGGSAR